MSERKDLLRRASKSTRFNLVDHNGKPITEVALKGQPTALFFGLTHCQNVCPTTLYEMSGWFDALGPEGADLKEFFILVDLLRDTQEFMKSISRTCRTGSPALPVIRKS
jgi:protein SCO1